MIFFSSFGSTGFLLLLLLFGYHRYWIEMFLPFVVVVVVLSTCTEFVFVWNENKQTDREWKGKEFSIQKFSIFFCIYVTILWTTITIYRYITEKHTHAHTHTHTKNIKSCNKSKKKKTIDTNTIFWWLVYIFQLCIPFGTSWILIIIIDSTTTILYDMYGMYVIQNIIETKRNENERKNIGKGNAMPDIPFFSFVIIILFFSPGHFSILFFFVSFAHIFSISFHIFLIHTTLWLLCIYEYILNNRLKYSSFSYLYLYHHHHHWADNESNMKKKWKKLWIMIRWMRKPHADPDSVI